MNSRETQHTLSTETTCTTKKEERKCLLTPKHEPVKVVNKLHNEGEDNNGSLEIEKIVCCICHCKVDYSEKYCFAKNDKKRGKDDNDMKHESSGCQSPASKLPNDSSDLEKTPDESNFLNGIVLPHNLYDGSNAILLCDTPGCDRAFHQRCHFTPVFCIPRGNWYCMICQYKKQVNAPSRYSKKQIRHGTKNKNKTSTRKRNSLKSQRECIYPPLKKNELDNIFRVDSEAIQIPTQSKESNDYHAAFEYHSASLKSITLQKELDHRIKAAIDHSLSKIRQAQFTNRAYMETEKARKAVISNYQISGRLPQELVQSLERMTQAKLRIKNILISLQKLIQNYDEISLLDTWLSGSSIVRNSMKSSIGINKESSNIGLSKIKIEISGLDKTSDSYKSYKKELFLDSVINRRREPRFDITDYDGSIEGSEDDQSKSEIIDKIRCSVCFSGVVSKDNDVLMCDGKDCFRAFHMKCVLPNVTQSQLDADEHGTWFCPLCTALANYVHYVQVEYEGDEYDVASSNSSSSWDDANDVFLEAENEFETVQKLKEGKHDNVTDEYLCSLIGIAFNRNDESTFQSARGDEPDDIDDDDDEDFESSTPNPYKNDDSSCSQVSSDEVSSIEWNVKASELDALSSCSSVGNDVESESTNDQTIDEPQLDNESKHQSQSRWNSLKKRRKRNQSSDLRTSSNKRKSAKEPDVGTLDTSNIVYGKRNRTKVDYRRLNDAMFGDLESDKAATEILDGKEGDDYHFTVASKKRKKKVSKKK